MAKQAVAAGAPVLIETPALFIPVGDYKWGTYSWDFVDKLLVDRSLLQQYDRWKLHVTEYFMSPEDLEVEAALMRKHKLSRQRVRSLYFSVCTNNIGVLFAEEHRALRGYGLFELMSRSNHSCDPTSRLVASELGSQAMALVASKDLKAGDSVTWSYFREDEFLPQDFVVRNFGLLDSYRFVCNCARCARERPAELANVKDLVPYFDELIRQEAKEMMQRPDGLEQVKARLPIEMHRQAYRALTDSSR